MRLQQPYYSAKRKRQGIQPLALTCNASAKPEREHERSIADVSACMWQCASSSSPSCELLPKFWPEHETVSPGGVVWIGGKGDHPVACIGLSVSATCKNGVLVVLVGSREWDAPGCEISGVWHGRGTFTWFGSTYGGLLVVITHSKSALASLARVIRISNKVINPVALPAM